MRRPKPFLILLGSACLFVLALTWFLASFYRAVYGNQVSGVSYSEARNAIQFPCDIPLDGSKYWVDSNSRSTFVIVEYDRQTEPELFVRERSMFHRVLSISWIPPVAKHPGIEVQDAYVSNGSTEWKQRGLAYAPAERILFIECAVGD
jgi:hypothetical protein